MLKLALISGSWPPDHCGVGDYARQLAKALEGSGVNVTCLGGSSTASLLGGYRLLDSIKAGRFDLVHLQYPTIGFGRSLVPSLLPLAVGKRPIVVTLHEFSTFKRIRRPWFATFAHFADARVFTSDLERRAFSEIMHPSRGIDAVIPIASNIRTGVSAARVPGSICNFGIISPGKGIEQFLELAAIGRNGPHFSFNLIGAEVETYADYARAIINRARQLGVKLHLNFPEAEVANLLASQEFAYLPYPDGASARRGTLLAAQQNGAVVLTTHSEQTPAIMRDTTVGVPSPAEAWKQLSYFRVNQEQLERFRARIGRGANHSWQDIAAAHVDLFERVINGTRPK